jgi:septal ring factor EnvC (AmiA/AmiB activator)
MLLIHWVLSLDVQPKGAKAKMSSDEIILAIVSKVEAGLDITDHELLILAQNNRILIQNKHESDRRIEELQQQMAALEARNESLDKTKQMLEKELAEEEERNNKLQDRIDSIWGIWGDTGKGWRVNLG